jgi:heme-degrading monooxygenase HmoA
MFNVIFEVRPRADQFDRYLELAQQLKPGLTATDGFIDNERFASLLRPGWVLSLSTWRDEKALVRWRTDAAHHRVQRLGRAQVFEDYRLQVGEVFADSAAGPGELPNQQRFDETEVGSAKALTATELLGSASAAQAWWQGAIDAAGALGACCAPSDAPIGVELYESIYTPGKVCALASWRSAAATQCWMPTAANGADVRLLRHRCLRVVRAYGLHDRREAPKFHAERPAAEPTPGTRG